VQFNLGGRKPAHLIERNHVMITLHHSQFTGSPSNLTDSLNRYLDAGIDPAFDSDMEELERQFAEYRLTLASE
jgi:hypothetical protein